MATTIPQRNGYVQPLTAALPQADGARMSPLGAMQNLTNSFLEMTMIMNEARDNDYFDSTVAALTNRMGERYITATTEAADYPEKFADGIETEFNKNIADALVDSPSDRITERIQKHMAGVVDGYKTKAKLFEVDAIGSFHDRQLGTTLDTHLKTAFRTPADVDDIYQLGLNAIDNKTEVLGPKTLQSRRDNWKAQVYGNAFDGFIDADPRAALAEVENGAWDDVFTVEQLKAATGAARQKVKMLDAEADKLERERLSELRSTITLSIADEKAARAAGKPAGTGGVTDDMIVAAYSDDPERTEQILGELEVLSSVASARTKLLSAQTLDAEHEIIESFAPDKGEAFVYAENSQAQDALRAVQKQKRQALQNDPLVFAQQTGLVENLQPFDPTNAEAVQARVAAVGKVKEHYGLKNISVLTSGEVDWMAGAFKSADSAQRTVMLKTLSENMSREAFQGLGAQMFAKDQPFMGAVTGIAGGGDMETARRVLEGADIRRTEKTIMPKMSDAVPHLNTHIGDAFRFLPALRPAYTDAALALYAYDAHDTGDRSALINPDRLNQSIDRVTGGIVTWNGVKTLAPARGMTDEDMEWAMDSLTDQELVKFGNGQPVTLSGHAVTSEHIREYGTVAVVGPRRYAVLLNGAPLMVAGEEGAEAGARYTIDLSRATTSGRFPIAPPVAD